MKHFIFIILSMAFFSSVHATEKDTYPFKSSIDETRFHQLTNEIRCVVCQNQSIADSNAPLANDLREKVYLMVLDQQTDEAIKNYLVKRYGDFILLQPRLMPQTFILWAFPFISIAFIFFFVFYSIKKKS